VLPATADDRPPPAPARTACPGVFVWQTAAGRETCACTRSPGHLGDHRDAAGYAWNDERWLD
jgi:hypothetical protein